MNNQKLLECITFFNALRIVEHDVTTDEERAKGQLIVVVDYSFSGKNYTTQKLYYRNINNQENVKHPELLNSFFNAPVYWLDIAEHGWPEGPGAKLERTVIPEIVSFKDTEFLSFLKKIANDDKDGWVQVITWEGRSPQYSVNLENNNHWHDIIRLIQAVIKSQGREVDKSLFKRLVFEWDENVKARTGLHPRFGSRSLIACLYRNIVSIQTQLKMEELKNLLKYKKQIILQGPPGTGKTRKAKELASEMIKGVNLGSPLQKIDEYFKNNNSVAPEIISQRNRLQEYLQQFWSRFPKNNLKDLSIEEYAFGDGDNDSFCWWIEYGLWELGGYSGQASKFKIFWKKSIQDYAKSGFVKDVQDDTEAMRLIAEQIFNAANEVKLTEAIDKLSKGYVLKVLHTYNPDKYFPINNEKFIDNVLKIFGGDGSSLDLFEKNKKIQEIFIRKKAEFNADVTNIEFMNFLFNSFDIRGNISLQSDQILTSGEFKIIQFHPAYSYEDFVRGIVVETNDKGLPYYKVVNKTLASFAQKAFDNQSSKYVLIIDEINRANLPAVLGELIYALEYRYDPDHPQETTVESVYGIKLNDEEDDGDKKLRLADNLFIIGTMNAADRSVGHIDYAIRRRFAFVDVLPELEPVHPLVKDIFKKVSELFVEGFVSYEDGEEIKPATETLVSDFRPQDVWIGHSYFICKKKDSDDDVEDHNARPILRNKLKYEVLPIIKEYVKDGILQDNEKTQAIIKELSLWS